MECLSFVTCVTTPIMSHIVIYVTVPVNEYLDYLVLSTKKVEDMKERMKQLNGTAGEVERSLERAVVNKEVVPESVEPWLEDVKKLNERAQKILTAGTRCFNLLERYKEGKESSDIVKDIEILKTRNPNAKFTHVKMSLSMVPSTSRSALVPDGTSQNNIFLSRDLLYKDALKALKSNNESEKMIALWGMGGVGKTTMMEQLEKVARDSKMFDNVVKVVLGKNHDTSTLQRDIAACIDKKLTEPSEYLRAGRLRMEFETMSQQGQKKNLVIMDDVWEKVNLQHIGLAKPFPNGFKLLFTSRFKDICTQMGVKTESIFEVRVLDEDEAKILFFGIVGSCDDDLELQKIGEDILKKCRGLPIAIVTIANVLCNNIKDKWIEVLSNLQKHDLEDLDDILHTVFEMSYNNLKTKDDKVVDDKAIFLLSGLFPEDFNIPIEDLMIYGWGLKLFTKVDTLAEARRRTNICVYNLICANLLMESESMGCVKMHDLTRAFVLTNFTKVKQASIFIHNSMSWPRHIEDTHDFYERILLTCNGDGMSEFLEEFTNHVNLSLLILIDENKSLKFPKDLHKRMEKLEVVSYENMNISLLSETFIHSSKLRTLCLRSCSLINDDIYHIGSLSNLETLSFAGCKVSRLPAVIGKLKNLKSLDLTGCVDLCIEDGIFENLKRLGELYMRASPGQPIRFTDDNCKELEKLSQRLFALELEFFENKVHPKHFSFKKLERFRILIGCELEETEKYSFRNALHLVAGCEELKECNISDLFEEAQELHLQVNDMYHLQGLSMNHSLFNLTDLHISECEKLTYLFTYDVASGLKKLLRLTISQCPVLRTLVSKKLGVIKFPKLSFMSLNGLPEMVSLCDDVIELPEMLELELNGLPKFMNIYSNNNNNICAMQTLLNEEVVIPKLEKLDISNMGNLKQIWPCENSTAEKKTASMLKKINIRKCISLVNLFPINPLPLLNHLEEIKVEECGSLEVLFNIDFECVCEMEGYISKLRSIIVNELGKLKELWRMRGVNNSDIHINVFKNVETIWIHHCGSFTYLFTPTITKFDLGALTTYFTEDIGEQIDHCISKREISKIDNLTYPSYLLHTCHHLQHLHLEYDRRVGEVVFEMDSTIQPPPILLLPYLKFLMLIYLEETSHVWKCNWNAFTIPQHQPLQLSFQNLVYISLKECHKIKYLFSPLMAKYLSNLKEVEVFYCTGIEEIISSRDDENEENTTSTSSNRNIVFFPRLDTLSLRELLCLKSVDGFQSAHVIRASWSFCQYPRKIDIYYCDALGSLVPWYVVGQMKKLEELKLDSCRWMTEVFESESIIYNTNDVDEGSAGNVTAGAMLTSPTLKSISTTVVGPQLSNLISVKIIGCHLLRHIFTFSTLESLKQLKELTVRDCKAIQVIVKEEKGAPSELVVFPRLEAIELNNLPNLMGFFLGANDFKWLSLDYVMINYCPELMMFTSGQSKTQKLKYICTDVGIYSVEPCDLKFDQTGFPASSDSTSSRETSLSFLNLVEFYIVNEYNETFIFPSHALLQLQKLEKITIKDCEDVEEVFDVELEQRNDSGFSESQTPTVVTILNLIQVELYKLHNLKYIWKSSQWMVLKFPNLTTVDISCCDKLEHVLTCSMVGSLVQLQVLSIKHCKNIKVIVKEEEEEHDAKVNEIIMLPRLKSLMLLKLSSLKGFCLGNDAFSLPTLNKLSIYRCPEVTLFTKGHLSTPELKEINTYLGLYKVEGDINSLIKTKQEEWNPRRRS